MSSRSPEAALRVAMIAITWCGATVIRADAVPTTARLTTADDSCCVPPAGVMAAKGSATQPSKLPTLRIDADANNLPFTSDELIGFENRIAAIIGEELQLTPSYTWRAQRRGFFKHALKEGECELVLGVPAGFEMGLTTKPYYRSSFAFVYRDTPELKGLRSLDDPRLKSLRIGIQLVGDDGANAPPAHALGARGLARNLVGYNVLGDYREANPPARVMRALAAGEVDVAVAWGPVAGYFAAHENKGLVVVPIAEEVDPLTKLPMTFNMCMAVRHGDAKLRDALNAALERRRADVERVLAQYHVPLLPVTAVPPAAAEDDD